MTQALGRRLLDSNSKIPAVDHIWALGSLLSIWVQSWEVLQNALQRCLCISQTQVHPVMTTALILTENSDFPHIESHNHFSEKNTIFSEKKSNSQKLTTGFATPTKCQSRQKRWCLEVEDCSHCSREQGGLPKWREPHREVPPALPPMWLPHSPSSQPSSMITKQCMQFPAAPLPCSDVPDPRYLTRLPPWHPKFW